MKIAVIGGGAAGFFASISAAEQGNEVHLFEKTSKVLGKVKISGGGRCNVTNETFNPVQLSKNYPRGERFLKKAFGKFNATHTLDWFKERGVEIKAEADGRMFPVTNESQTIIDCLMEQANINKVKVHYNSEVSKVIPQENSIELIINNEVIVFDKVIVTIGGQPKKESFSWLEKLGHKIESPVPSLFTFKINHKPLSKLMGLSVDNAKVRVVGEKKLQEEGPLLITHWGLSGPAILRTSAWGARLLSDRNYQFDILVSWYNKMSDQELREFVQEKKIELKKKQIKNKNPFELPQRLWDYLLERIEIPETKLWLDLSKKELNKLVEVLLSDNYSVHGTTKFKEEFVTCGGVSLSDIDVKTMESKKCSHLHFAGEVMDIDGITGGFNFQAAWTTGFISGNSMKS
ncbi:BaiN/RdsA family NAD(P)/FAD-dependent oxidoreductase [Flammeovirga agarivorans]|uniref:NAD(P)/FAD-dependent oxidoreductase n=1 Tax=Flammeovirga agarivorans TaxID=2726742 RepID=A0A7X8SLY1_9BACT|nr:NAD(P)/FAD-dependent oxidoreductase [Flammeovirga agarivorans]NLR92655.1 NAD(P)/FAD-dependent oxidoreductase [Flammeovirga agarivorans]